MTTSSQPPFLRTVGIDPGLQGALAVLDWQDGAYRLQTVTPLPICETLQGRDQIDIHGTQALLAPWKGSVARCAIEQAGVRPGEGPSGAFTFGRLYGRLETVLALMAFPFVQPTPQTWKKVVFAGSGIPLKSEKASQKEAAIAYVKSLFPGVSLRRTSLARVDDHNMAEAVCLAVYALHHARLTSSNPQV